jgi:hypothetical protein
LKVIRRPGFTTPAEFAFLTAMLNAVQMHVTAIDTLQAEILTASKSVGE